MKATVFFFGPLHDVTGFSREEVTLRDGETLAGKPSGSSGRAASGWFTAWGAWPFEKQPC